jgi:ABC-type antimicrobial peptide transport system permease subunit
MIFIIVFFFFCVFVSAIIGLLSGFIPAWSASRLDPVEAMRTAI